MAFGNAGRWLFGRPYLLLCFVGLFWAGNTVVGRSVAGHVPPVAMSFIRWSVGFLILLPFAWPHLRRDWPQIRAHLGLMTMLAVTGISAYNTMAYTGLQYTQALNGLLLQSIGPLFIAIWTFLLFGERLSVAQGVGITVSLLGVLTIISHGDPALLAGVQFNRGDLWLIAALLIFGFYSALTKRRPRIHAVSFLAFTMGWGAAWLIPVVALEMAQGYRLTPDIETVAALAYVSVFPSVIAYLFFNRAIELVGPNRTAPFMHLTPLFGSVLAIVLLGERLQFFHAAGYALILGGITIATRRWRRG